MPKKGLKMTDEHKRKISEANKISHIGLSWGKHSDDHKEKMRALRVGKKLSEETKKKLSISMKGKNSGKKKPARSEEHCKKLSAAHKMRGAKLTTHQIENLQDGRRRYFDRVGRKSLVQKIVRNSFIYRQWRSDVFRRDEFICVICEKKGNELNADHIKPFSVIMNEYSIKTLEQAEKCSELWDINNGRTLCIECHKKTPSYAKNLKNTV